MAELAIFEGKVVQIVYRRQSPDGKSVSSVKIQLPNGETAVVLHTRLQPFTPPAEDKKRIEAQYEQLNLFDQNHDSSLGIASQAMESFAAIANPGPLPRLSRSTLFIDRVTDPGELVKLPTIGKIAAKGILDRRNSRPDNKYGSFKAMVEANAELRHVDWDQVRPLVSFESELESEPDNAD